MKTAELFPDRMRLAIPLGAFVGLRLGEACGLRVGLALASVEPSEPARHGDHVGLRLAVGCRPSAWNTDGGLSRRGHCYCY
jgi:hypothetical protein